MSAIEEKKRENQKRIEDIDDQLRQVDRHMEEARKQADNLRAIPGLHVPPQPQAGQMTPD